VANQQGEQFIDLLFAKNKGYAAVAAKNGAGGAWSEQTFHWPEDRDLLLSWAHHNRKGDVFICPALRKSPDRMKSDGAHLQWLWADVDFQDVPTDKVSLVHRRINKISSMVISSGSGDNVHVYVKLPKAQTLDIWRRLNAGLRDYLYADAKHTDNALLRLPGTINRKPEGGRVGIKQTFNGQVAEVQKLLDNKVWKEVVITDDKGANDGAFDRVDVSHLLGRSEIRRRVTMDTDEAQGRYGTRHGAVYQVASWLSKKGLTADQIHTLMAEFPAGVDKEETERGYSLHVDIDRCLSANPTVEALEIVEDVFEIVEDSGNEPDDSLLSSARKRVRALDVEDLARQMRAQRSFMPPPAEVSYRWSDHIATPRPPLQYAVEGIAAVGQNVTITGQYKAGKTLLGVNLIRCLVDNEPFLGEFKTEGNGAGSNGSVGFWSLEMSMSDLDGYIDPIGLGNADRLVVLSGRGYGVNILTDVGKQWTVNWLQDGSVKTWVVDSHARMCRMAGVDENDNGAVLNLLHRLDEIKELAGVGELFYLVHTGRGEQQEGRERARGATVIDDWADARWVLTRQDKVRFLAVEGRSVQDMTARSLVFNEGTKRMTLGKHNPAEAKTSGLTDLLISLVMDHDGITWKSLTRLVRERAGSASERRIEEARDEALLRGRIREKSGVNRSKHYHAVEPEDGSFDEEESGVTPEDGERDTGRDTRRATPRGVNPRDLTDAEVRSQMKRRNRGKKR